MAACPLGSLVPSRPRRFRMWTSPVKLVGKIRYRARFQASSGLSDSANRPGYEAVLWDEIFVYSEDSTSRPAPSRNWKFRETNYKSLGQNPFRSNGFKGDKNLTNNRSIPHVSMSRSGLSDHSRLCFECPELQYQLVTDKVTKVTDYLCLETPFWLPWPQWKRSISFHMVQPPYKKDEGIRRKFWKESLRGTDLWAWLDSFFTLTEIPILKQRIISCHVSDSIPPKLWRCGPIEAKGTKAAFLAPKR